MSKTKSLTKRPKTITLQERQRAIGTLENWLALIASGQMDAAEAAAQAASDREACSGAVEGWVEDMRAAQPGQQWTREDAIAALRGKRGFEGIDYVLASVPKAVSLPVNSPALEDLRVARGFFEALADAHVSTTRLDARREEHVLFYSTLFRMLECVGPDRIRRCLHCNAIFYATRLNKRLCSPACGNIRRVQKSRIKQRANGTEYKRRYRKSPGAKLKAKKAKDRKEGKGK